MFTSSKESSAKYNMFPFKFMIMPFQCHINVFIKMTLLREALILPTILAI